MLRLVIVVTGCRRSGTSMWMQIFAAAGFPMIGDAFPLDWETVLGPANPRGFFESTLRDGIHFGSNPDPRSGVYLHPEETRRHAVKVFAEGLVRSDLSFLDRVVVTLRPWRQYAASMERLYAVENSARGWTLAQRPPRLCGALEWWFSNFGLIRDVALRRYRIHIQPYAQVLERPREVVTSVLNWATEGSPETAAELNIDAAVAVVGLSRGETSGDGSHAGAGLDRRQDLPVGALDVFDTFYDAVANGQGLSQSLLARMNALQTELEPRIVAHDEGLVAWLAEHAGKSGAAGPLALG